eukprot:TRINITY_DN5476_c0_g1_i22.p1 TRINITY_DN5476_c0_g1~~TRINITY_DN5476_c0_g1_i22.p1  ORF type:complete len:187 (+),score=37.62 TRINITY_DN5476_c0_g1_i22:65-625(+)
MCIRDSHTIVRDIESFRGFNVVLGNLNTGTFRYMCNGDQEHSCKIFTLDPGFYGLSNSSLFEKWEKTRYGAQMFEKIAGLAEDEADLLRQLVCLMNDSTTYDKGPFEKESSIFIERYKADHFGGDIRGTQNTTYILIDQELEVRYIERFYTGNERDSESMEYEGVTNSITTSILRYDANETRKDLN